MGNKYSQKLFDSAKKSKTDSIKAASKRAIQKTAEATGYLLGHKIVDKITNASQKSSRQSQNDDANNEIEVPKKDIYFQKIDKKNIDELRLV